MGGQVMDDLIYWNGVAVGCMEGGRVVFFSNAPREAIEALS